MEKCGFKNATNVLGSLTLPAEHTGGAYNTDRIGIPERVIRMLHGRLVHVGKTLTDLQILGCELVEAKFHYAIWFEPASNQLA